MRVTTAQLPGPSESQDRIFLGPDVVIMLDGASAFAPTGISASEYVDTLGPRLLGIIGSHPEVQLVDALADGIEYAARRLSLSAGSAPSSTVAIARTDDDVVELLVLGDTQIATPTRELRDDRIERFGRGHRAEYQARLRAGHGYDERHRGLLQVLQQEQRRHRNRVGGYWIAEADASAAAHAFVVNLSRLDTPWLVLATDGAYRPMNHLRIDDWRRLAVVEESELHEVLARCHAWEAGVDPNGVVMPRAKRHDDKSLAAVRLASE